MALPSDKFRLNVVARNIEGFLLPLVPKETRGAIKDVIQQDIDCIREIAAKMPD